MQQHRSLTISQPQPRMPRGGPIRETLRQWPELGFQPVEQDQAYRKTLDAELNGATFRRDRSSRLVSMRCPLRCARSRPCRYS